MAVVSAVLNPKCALYWKTECHHQNLATCTNIIPTTLTAQIQEALLVVLRLHRPPLPPQRLQQVSVTALTPRGQSACANGKMRRHQSRSPPRMRTVPGWMICTTAGHQLPQTRASVAAPPKPVAQMSSAVLRINVVPTRTITPQKRRITHLSTLFHSTSHQCNRLLARLMNRLLSHLRPQRITPWKTVTASSGNVLNKQLPSFHLHPQ
jgi:hypothetical protein